jgi:crotonobetainyl-CoA:carnitine CoA-transferase CaiB-like acyl-CoA transferase
MAAGVGGDVKSRDGQPMKLPAPLAGIRVIDFTNVMAGPVCTRLLADMGAEVIKVEPPEGDHSRTRPPIRNGFSAHYAHLNCGKKSVALDLKSVAGRKAALDLCMVSDVVVENWRPGVAARLGLGYEELNAAHPEIVYCAISGYGQTGPNAQLPAFASIVEARSGFSLAQMKLDGADKPQNSGIMLGDTLSGVWAFSGVQTALVQRERTGKGALVDVAMHDCMLFSLIYECHEAQFGPSIRRVHIPVRTRDGYMQVPPITERNFHDLARAIGREEWIRDPRFASVEGRNVNWFELLRLIEDWTKERTTEECEAILIPARVPCARFRTVAEAMRDPHLAERGTITTIKDGGGTYMLPNAGFRMPNHDIDAKPDVADFDEDAEAVLGDILGYSAEQIADCRVQRRGDG